MTPEASIALVESFWKAARPAASGGVTGAPPVQWLTPSGATPSPFHEDPTPASGPRPINFTDRKRPSARRTRQYGYASHTGRGAPAVANGITRSLPPRPCCRSLLVRHALADLII